MDIMFLNLHINTAKGRQAQDEMSSCLFSFWMGNKVKEPFWRAFLDSERKRVWLHLLWSGMSFVWEFLFESDRAKTHTCDCASQRCLDQGRACISETPMIEKQIGKLRSTVTMEINETVRRNKNAIWSQGKCARDLLTREATSYFIQWLWRWHWTE